MYVVPPVSVPRVENLSRFIFANVFPAQTSVYTKDPSSMPFTHSCMYCHFDATMKKGRLPVIPSNIIHPVALEIIESSCV